MRKITRREFLEISATVAFSLVLPESLWATQKEKTVIAGPLIGVAHGNKSKLVKAAIDAVGGIDKFIRQGDRVLIKPNISFAANVECGVTTSPEIVKQVVRLCLDAGASKIIIIDYPLANPELCVEKTRIKEAIIDKTKVGLLVLGKERQFVEIKVPQGRELKNVKIAKEIQMADKLINLPNAKSHSTTGVSLGLKNLMGLVWNRGYFHRVNIHQAIAELATVIKPNLTIVDTTRVLISGGPGGPGKTIELNKVIAGTDVVAIDSYVVGITPWYNKSFKGSNVKYIVAASELGLGEIDTQKVVTKEVEI